MTFQLLLDYQTNGFLLGAVILLVIASKSIPIVLHALKLDLDYLKTSSKSLKLKTQLLDKRNVHIVFPSKNLMAKHSKINQYNKINFHYIPTSVDCSIFSRDQSLHKEVLEREENIIYFSFTAADPYNDARKNLAFAVDLVSELNKKFIAKYSINLIIVGGDPNSSATAYNESFITKIAYTNDTSTLRQIYSNSSLHLTTSVADNLPNTTLEALACGCPLASYNCGGLSEVTVDEYNGYLFNSLSMIEWVSRLLIMLQITGSYIVPLFKIQQI